MNHPNELDQQLDNLRTLQESESVLSDYVQATLPDAQAGKNALAQAISLKGVQTENTDSLQTMAEHVGQIAQTPIVYNDGEIYAKQICGEGSQWDLYTKTADLWNEYRNEYGAIMMALYFKGYASIDLDTAVADSYITSDGCYYHYLNGNWVKEKNGTIEVVTLDNTTIHHYWDDDDDGYMDRFVAYMFYSAGRDYTVPSTNLCPRAIFYAGVLGTINCTVAGRIREIVKIGDESYFQGVNFTNTQQWGQVVNIRGAKKHTSGSVIYNDTRVALYYDEVEEITEPIINGSANGVSALNAVYLPKASIIKTSADSKSFIVDEVAKNISYLYFGAEELTVDYKLYRIRSKTTIIFNAKKIITTNLGALIETPWDSGHMSDILAPNLTEITGTMYICSNLNSGYSEIGKIYTPLIKKGYILGGTNARQLKDVWVGEYEQNLNLSAWTAQAYTSAEDIAILNANIRDHIAARIADGGSTQTITFGANLFNNLEQATIDAFDAKHWIVASA